MMQVHLEHSDHLQIVCSGRLIGEIIAAEIKKAPELNAEVENSRAAVAAVYQMRQVEDWAAFADGVQGRWTSYPGGQEGLPDVIPTPHGSDTAKNRVYQKSFLVGVMMARVLARGGEQ